MDTTKPGVQNPHCRPWVVAERLLDGGQLPSGRREPLDRRDLGPLGLHREHQARPHGGAVDEHRARAAHAVLAPEVGAGERAVLAEEVGERLAGLDERRRAPSPLTVTATTGRQPRRASSSACAQCPADHRCGRRAPVAATRGGRRVGRALGRGEPADLLGVDARRPRVPSSAASAVRAAAASAPCRTGRSRTVVTRRRRRAGPRRPRRRSRSRRGDGRTPRRRSRSGPLQTGNHAVEQLVGLERRRPEPLEELGGGDAPGARRRRPRARRRGRGRPLGTRPQGRRGRATRRSCRGCGSGSDR